MSQITPVLLAVRGSLATDANARGNLTCRRLTTRQWELRLCTGVRCMPQSGIALRCKSRRPLSYVAPSRRKGWEQDVAAFMAENLPQSKRAAARLTSSR